MWTLIDFRQMLGCHLVCHTIRLFLLTGIGSGLVSAAAWGDVGLLPTPTLQGVQVQAEASFDLGTQRYTYSYTVSNPSTNTGQIWNIRIDVTQPLAGSQLFDTSGLTIPHGGNNFPFDEELAELRPLTVPAGTTVIAFGQRVPSGWNGGLYHDGLAGFNSSVSSVEILPGQTRTGFELISPGLPTIRKAQLHPFWTLLVDNFENVTPEQEMAAREVERSIISHTFTIGPSAHTPGTFAHWEQVRDDLNQAIQLGWTPDQALATTLVTQLASARQALNAGDGTLAKTRLQTLIQTINQSTPTQRRREVADLLVLNAQRLIAATPDTPITPDPPIPFEPKLNLSPQSSTLSLGALYTLTATVTNLGDPTNPPIPGFDLGFQVLEGPHAGQGLSGVTDADGKLSFSYTGTQVGTDKITAGIFGEVIEEKGAAEVIWTGGPDLVVPLFIPPVIKREGGRPVLVTESTTNIGTVASAPSTTRYFLSSETTIDPATARVLGERTVPTLGPGESHQTNFLAFTLPSDLPAGVYYLAACADAAGAVVELDEQNNCSFSTIEGHSSAVVALEREAISNNPPVCSQASPSVARLWPPNHKLATITIQGVTDPGNDPVTLRVTGITQDEPVNGLGDGDTSPDGFGVGTAQAQVRKERSGTGNGRVYAIAFTAEDGKGGSCTGTVTVGVPHDQGQGSTPIDDGQVYDSTRAS